MQVGQESSNQKTTWSINISTGGPRYDFTSSHASYFCHKQTQQQTFTATNTQTNTLTTKYTELQFSCYGITTISLDY